MFDNCSFGAKKCSSTSATKTTRTSTDYKIIERLNCLSHHETEWQTHRWSESYWFFPFCHARLFSIFFGPTGKSEGLGRISRGLRPGNQCSGTRWRPSGVCKTFENSSYNFLLLCRETFGLKMWWKSKSVPSIFLLLKFDSIETAFWMWFLVCLWLSLCCQEAKVCINFKIIIFDSFQDLEDNTREPFTWLAWSAKDFSFVSCFIFVDYYIQHYSCKDSELILQAKINRIVWGCLKTPEDFRLKWNLVNHFNHGEHTLMEIL